MAEIKFPQRKLTKLKEKGFNLSIPVIEMDAWNILIKKDRSIPRSYAQLKRLSRQLFNAKYRDLVRKSKLAPLPRKGTLFRGHEECGESNYYRFFIGLSNPWLTKKQFLDLEADVDADTPTFDNSTETDHFILKWTNSSTNANDNIANSTIVTDTGGYLEDAWSKYEATFGETPYVPTGESKIEVLFHDISGYGVASPPNGPIQFDAPNWISKPGIRQPTSAHELFHKLQYKYGYRTTWSPVSPYKWFSEGTASWAEVFVWQRVSGAYKINDLFSNTDINLYDASYKALPFWIFFQARQQDSSVDNPMVSFLEKYQTHGDEETALVEAVEDEWAPNNVHRHLANFFALFSRERVINAWKVGPSGVMYNEILDPDDNILAPEIAETEIMMGLGDSYSNTANVSRLGSDYYRFVFQSSADSQTIAVSVDGAEAGDFSYYLVWEKEGMFRRGVFPFMATEDYSFSETIDRSYADSVTLIVSGRGTGGSYTLNTSIV
jgi:hypothetical protein